MNEEIKKNFQQSQIEPPKMQSKIFIGLCHVLDVEGLFSSSEDQHQLHEILMKNGPQTLLQLWAFVVQSMSQYRPDGYPFRLNPSSINLLAAGSLTSSTLLLCYNMGKTRLKILEEKEKEVEQEEQQIHLIEEGKDKDTCKSFVKNVHVLTI